MTRTRAQRREPIPVIALTGDLGAGKTTLLNHVLRAPGARIGVVINDFGDINVDACLVSWADRRTGIHRR
jgi:G3E family GTPase